MNRLLLPLLLAFAAATLPAQQPEPAWIHAAEKRGAMSADETKAFMKRLAQHAVEHHMKKAEGSPQRGMMYEYLRWSRRGQPGQFIRWSRKVLIVPGQRRMMSSTGVERAMSLSRMSNSLRGSLSA